MDAPALEPTAVMLTPFGVQNKSAEVQACIAAEPAARCDSAPSPVAQSYSSSFSAGTHMLDIGARSARDFAALLWAGRCVYPAFHLKAHTKGPDIL